MDASTLDRFRKILGLLGSDHDGERSAAALKATAMLKAAGVTWADVGPGGIQTVYVRDQNGGVGVSSDWAVSAMRGEMQKWKRLCEDERSGNALLREALAEARKTIDQLRASRHPGAAPTKEVPPKPNKKKARRQRRMERQQAQEEARQPGPETIEEKALREQVHQTLSSYDAGELNLSERTEEFLRSVSRQGRWTDRQREAVERTMQWVWKQ